MPALYPFSLPLYLTDVIFKLMSFVLGVALNDLTSGENFVISSATVIYLIIVVVMLVCVSGSRLKMISKNDDTSIKC